MDTFHEKYRRLARDPFGLASLWLAEDHLVYVKGSGFLMPFSEQYKRFRLSEIEALTVAKTSRVAKGVLYLALLLLCSIAATLVFVLDEDPGPFSIAVVSVFAVAGLILAALLLRHLVLGPTCLCDIQTRLTRERLRPLKRYHHAVETVRRLEELIRASQTGLIEVEGAQMAGERPRARREVDFYQIPRVVPPLFGVFALVGVLAIVGLALESLFIAGGVLLFLLGASMLLTLALVATVRKPTPEVIRTALWFLMGLHFLVVGVGSIYYLVVAMQEPAYTVGLTGPIEAFAALASEGGAVLFGVFCALFLGYVSVGIWGLAMSAKWRRQIAAVSAQVDGSEGAGKQ